MTDVRARTVGRRFIVAVVLCILSCVPSVYGGCYFFSCFPSKKMVVGDTIVYDPSSSAADQKPVEADSDTFNTLANRDDKERKRDKDSSPNLRTTNSDFKTIK